MTREQAETIYNGIRRMNPLLDEAISVLTAEKRVPLVDPPKPIKMGICKDCKHWRDSDGLYRRGINAESNCPINRSEVYEGNGYCYMFEPKEK